MKKAIEMSHNELITAARNYDNIHNEGGEGYNPYSAEIDRREQETSIAQAKSHAATPQGKIDALYRRIQLECGSVAREWGNNSEIDDKQTKIYSEINRLKADIETDFLVAWPIELTKARRTEWNDFIQNTIGTGKVGPDESRAIYRKQSEQGWMMDDLKKAVKLHNLGPAK